MNLTFVFKTYGSSFAQPFPHEMSFLTPSLYLLDFNKSSFVLLRYYTLINDY